MGIRLEPARVAFGDIEHPRHVGGFLRRYAEHLLEGGHLVAGHIPVHLGHLGTQRDDADGEGDLACRIVGGLVIAGRFKFRRDIGIIGMARQRAEDGAERPPECKADTAAHNLAPDTHFAPIPAGRPACLSRAPVLLGRNIIGPESISEVGMGILLRSQ